jgi:hypothetical protein
VGDAAHAPHLVEHEGDGPDHPVRRRDHGRHAVGSPAPGATVALRARPDPRPVGRQEPGGSPPGGRRARRCLARLRAPDPRRREPRRAGDGPEEARSGAPCLLRRRGRTNGREAR